MATPRQVKAKVKAKVKVNAKVNAKVKAKVKAKVEAKAKSGGGVGAKSRSGSSALGGSPGVTHQTVRELALALPGVEEGTSYGTPAFRVKKKPLVRFHQNGESLVLFIDMEDREILMRTDPDVFYITDHYRGWPALLVRLAKVNREALRYLLEELWRRNAPKSLIDAYDEEAEGRG